MQYIIDIPDSLVTEHQLKLILTKEIRSSGCKDCKTRCIECTHISVKPVEEASEKVLEETYKYCQNDIARKRRNV